MSERKNRLHRAFFAVLLAALIAPAGAFAQDVIAYLGEVGGAVVVVRGSPGEGEGETAAKQGMLLQGGDTVRTGEESYASVVFQDDGSRVKLGPVSTLTLNAARKDKQLDKKLFLETGKLWAKVTKKKGSDFQVKTPTSVASVKGTRFVLEETAEGVTWVWVLEDAVQLSNETGEVTVNEGQKGTATRDALNVEDMGEGELPVEPGSHEVIFFFKSKDGSSLQRELHIEYEK